MQGYLTYEQVLAGMLDCARQMTLLHQFEDAIKVAQNGEDIHRLHIEVVKCLWSI